MRNLRRYNRSQGMLLMRAIPEAAFNFIATEFAACELFLDLAAKASRDDVRAGYLRNARKAHDAIVRFLPRLHLPQVERKMYRQRLASLKAKLGSSPHSAAASSQTPPPPKKN